MLNIFKIKIFLLFKDFKIMSSILFKIKCNIELYKLIKNLVLNL